MSRFLTGVAILALALGHPPARANAAEDAAFVDIHFADLDLTRVEGAAELYHRLELAAQTVCAALDGHARAHRRSYQACVRRAINEAVVRVDRPSVAVN